MAAGRALLRGRQWPARDARSSRSCWPRPRVLPPARGRSRSTRSAGRRTHKGRCASTSTASTIPATSARSSAPRRRSGPTASRSDLARRTRTARRRSGQAWARCSACPLARVDRGAGTSELPGHHDRARRGRRRAVARTLAFRATGCEAKRQSSGGGTGRPAARTASRSPADRLRAGRAAASDHGQRRPHRPHPDRHPLPERRDGRNRRAVRGDYHGARTMTERIAQIRQEAEQAITAAASTQALEDVRIRYLGRKAELPNLLRDVASLPPDERAATGKAANEARKALEQAIETQSRRPRRSRARHETRPGQDRRHAPRRPAPGNRAPAPDDEDEKGDRGCVHRPRLQRRRGPRGREGLLQLRRAQPRADSPLAADHGHVLHQAADRHLRPAVDAAQGSHEPDADPRDGAAAATDLHHRPRPRLPARQRRHAHAAVPPDRGARGRHRHHARPTSRGRCSRSRRRSSARSAGCG